MKTDASENVLVYGERRIAYRLHRSDRKRLRIVVRPDLSVLAHAPKSFSEQEIAAAVWSRRKWVAKQIAAFEEFHPLPPPHRYVSGETISYLGRQYRLKVIQGETTPAKLRGRFLHVIVPDRTNSANIEKAVNSWYRIRAEDTFRRYIDTCMIIASRHGIEEPVYVIRDMRTRWGSCSATGRLTLNLRLVQAPAHCVEYVIMHELCHLAHHDHSRAYLRLLTRCMPDWEKRRGVLQGVVFSSGPGGMLAADSSGGTL
jgi:predicted metal-dependent hydrolase